MDEQTFQELLEGLLLENTDHTQLVSVRSFGEAMLLTDNRGLVVRMADGSEFQVTVVQSRSAS